MKAIEEPNRIEAEKRRKKRLKIGTVVGVLVIAFMAILVYIWYCMQPLDRILDYRVSVTPQADGSLVTTYNIRWKVLNDSREGPLTWVKIGMANENFEIIDYGGDIAKPHGYPSLIGSLDPYYAEFDLNRHYYKGEVAEFWFTVRQRRMLCRDSPDSEQVFYDFTPGWFNSIEVEHYLFTWHDPVGALGVNGDRQQNDDYFWEGALPKGGVRQMKVFYAKQDFPNAIPVKWYPSSKTYGGGDTPEGPSWSVIALILIVAGFVEFQIWNEGNSYRRGRGYTSRYHGYGGRGGHGGGCACACAGCACACACAGGGRAGCSNKDFYKNEEPD